MLLLEIVPYHHCEKRFRLDCGHHSDSNGTFVLRISRRLAATHQRQIVAPEEHLDVTDAAIGEIWPRQRVSWLATHSTDHHTLLLLLLERIAVVNSEARLQTTSKTTLVLVESDKEQAVGAVVDVHC